MISFWNTTVDPTIEMSSCSNEQLIGFLEDLVTHDTWNNGGQLVDGELGRFYKMVYQEILDRMKKSHPHLSEGMALDGL